MSFGFRGRGRGRGGAAAARPATDPDPFEHIKSEIAVMKKLAHPNIIKLYEVLDAPEHDSLYMVFELCGPPVMDVGLDTEGEGVGEEKAREIMREAALGIEYRGAANEFVAGKPGLTCFLTSASSPQFTNTTSRTEISRCDS